MRVPVDQPRRQPNTFIYIHSHAARTGVSAMCGCERSADPGLLSRIGCAAPGRCAEEHNLANSGRMSVLIKILQSDRALARRHRRVRSMGARLRAQRSSDRPRLPRPMRCGFCQGSSIIARRPNQATSSSVPRSTTRLRFRGRGCPRHLRSTWVVSGWLEHRAWAPPLGCRGRPAAHEIGGATFPNASSP